MTMDVGQLQGALEREALRELAHEWHAYNEELFDGRLMPPVLRLSEGVGTLGRWIADRSCLELDRALVFERPWTAVREVLKHEMAHQFVSEVLQARDETAHGAAFRDVCTRLGIDPRARGLPDVGPSDAAPSRLIERVAKLLALAGSTNEHEAQTAMSAAQRLMLEHNLAAVTTGAGRRFVSRELAAPVARLEESRSQIGALLAAHFFVQAIELRVWMARERRRGTVIEITGTLENVALAEYVYAFLDRTADALWAEHKRGHGVSGNRDRRAFRAGVVRGFRLKLEAEQSAQVERGLVWIGDPELRRHHRARYPRISNVRLGGGGAIDARRHGEAAGRTVVLHRGVEAGGAPDAGAPKRLGSGRSPAS